MFLSAFLFVLFVFVLTLRKKRSKLINDSLKFRPPFNLNDIVNVNWKFECAYLLTCYVIIVLQGSTKKFRLTGAISTENHFKSQ